MVGEQWWQNSAQTAILTQLVRTGALNKQGHLKRAEAESNVSKRLGICSRDIELLLEFLLDLLPWRANTKNRNSKNQVAYLK